MTGVDDAATVGPVKMARWTATPWAAAVLDLRITERPLTATVPAITVDTKTATLAHHVDPDQPGWSLTLWETDPARYDDTPVRWGAEVDRVAQITAPDGTAVGVADRWAQESPSRRGRGAPGQWFSGLTNITLPLGAGRDVTADVWPLLRSLHAALLDPTDWFTAQPDQPFPAGGVTSQSAARRLLSWAPYGHRRSDTVAWEAAGIRTGRSLTVWRNMFPDDAIADWATVFHPRVADAWADRFPDLHRATAWHALPWLPLPLAHLLDGLGWDPEDAAPIAETLEYRELPRGAADRIEALAGIARRFGFSPADAVALHLSGIPLDEIQYRLSTRTLDMTATRVLASLR